MFNKSLDSILGTFNKVSLDLNAFIERSNAETVQLNDKANELLAQAVTKSRETVRAKAVLGKIESLIN